MVNVPPPSPVKIGLRFALEVLDWDKVNNNRFRYIASKGSKKLAGSFAFTKLGTIIVSTSLLTEKWKAKIHRALRLLKTIGNFASTNFSRQILSRKDTSARYQIPKTEGSVEITMFGS